MIYHIWKFVGKSVLHFLIGELLSLGYDLLTLQTILRHLSEEIPSSSKINIMQSFNGVSQQQTGI